VLSIGLNGSYGLDRVKQGMAKLEAWLAAHPEWIADGSPRAFYYNGPYVPNARKWSEIQVPVRPKDGGSAWPTQMGGLSSADPGEIAAAPTIDPVD
jgi:hypothetical protein